MTRFRLVLLLSLFAFLPQANAQIGLYGNFTASKIKAPNINWIYGTTFGAYYDPIHLPLVAFGIDARVAILGNGSSPELRGGLIGPRVVLHLPAVPVRPYAEVLGGASRLQVGQGATYSDGVRGNYGVAVGADLTFFPRLDWRVLEYTYSRFSSPSYANSQQTLSTGLVFRLPIP